LKTHLDNNQKDCYKDLASSIYYEPQSADQFQHSAGSM
jgi:hypothetical protein